MSLNTSPIQIEKSNQQGQSISTDLQGTGSIPSTVAQALKPAIPAQSEIQQQGQVITTALQDTVTIPSTIIKNIQPESLSLPSAQEDPRLESVTPELSNELRLLLQYLDQQEKPAALPMDHRMAAHFLGDYFVKEKNMGEMQLEGASHVEMSSSFLDYLAKAAAEEGVAGQSKIKTLKQSLSQIIEVGQVIAALFLQYPHAKQWETRAKLFSEWMFHRLHSMQVGEHFTIPGGYQKHAMVYEIVKTTDSSYEMCIYNTGRGLKYHPKMENINIECMQALTTNPVSSEKMHSGVLWQAYFETVFEANPADSTHREMNAQAVYTWLSAIDENVFKKAMGEARSNDVSMRRPQRAGICAFESLLLLSKEYLSDSPNSSEGNNIYQKMRSKMREMALRDYDKFLVSEGLLSKDSLGPFFSSKNKIKIIKNIGALEFLEEVSNKLRRETWRNIRKNRQEKRSDVLNRTSYLDLLQQRIQQRKKQCEDALKQLSQLPPLEKSADTTIHFNELAPTSIESSAPSSSMSTSTLVSAWPDAAEMVGVFNEIVSTFPAMSIDADDDGDETSATIKNEQYDLLVWAFKAMPSANSEYWEEICKNGQAQECIALLSKCSSRFFCLTDKLNIPLQADLHFFQMQKVLSILLKLSQNDPVVKDCHINLSALGLTKTGLQTGCFFATDPAVDQDFEAARTFFRTYEDAPHKDKIPLFGHLSKVPSQGQSSIAINSDWSENPTLKHIWDAMPSSLKGQIEERLKEKYGHPPSNALVLAYALSSDTDFPPSQGYRALQQHILNMQTLWHRGRFLDYYEIGIYQAQNESISSDGLSQWEQLGDSSVNFEVQFKEVRYAEGPIDEYVTKNCIPSSSDQAASLMKRAATEKEVMQQEDRDLLLLENMQCVDDRGHQLLKVLLYYTQNRHLLSNPTEQVRLSSLLLEPGVLIEQLRINPDLISPLAKFVHLGMQAFGRGADDDEPTALFFLRLSTYLETYSRKAGISQSQLDQLEMPHFLQELQMRWEAAQKLGSSSRIKTCSILAREAMAYCGRGGEITPDSLPALLKCRFFLAECPLTNGLRERLDIEMRQGIKTLTDYVCGMSDGPALQAALSKALGVESEEVFSAIGWITKPVITSSNGRYTVNLYTGEVFVDGKARTMRIPGSLIDNPEFKRLFPHPEKLTNILIRTESDGTPSVFFDDRSAHYLAKNAGANKMNLFRKFPDGTYHPYYPQGNLPLGIQKTACASATPWCNEKNKSISFIDDSGKERYIYKAGRLLEQQTQYAAADMSTDCQFYRQLQSFDPAAQSWRKGNAVAARVDLPTFGLVLDIDPHGIVQGRGSLSGFKLAKDQHVGSLSGIPFLAFEHQSTGEKRVLLPIYSVDLRRDFEQLFSYSTEKNLLDSPKYCTFTVDRAERLHSDSLKDRLYLALCFLSMRKYLQASHILQTQVQKLSPYDLDERALLLELASSINLKTDKNSLSNLVRLRALALLLENEKLGIIEPKNQADEIRLDSQKQSLSEFRGDQDNSDCFSAFQGYCDQVHTVSESARLSSQEMFLLEEALPLIRQERLRQNTLKLGLGRSLKLDPLGPHARAEFDSSFWNKEFHAADAAIFDKHVLPLTIDETTLAAHFLSLYTIAISTVEDAASCKNRAKLETWLSCMQGQSVDDCMKYPLKLLYQIVRLPREQAKQLPFPNEYEIVACIRDVEEWRNNMNAYLDRVNPTKDNEFIDYVKGPKVHKEVNHTAPAALPFLSIKDPTPLRASEKDLRNDLPCVPCLSTLFTREGITPSSPTQIPGGKPAPIIPLLVSQPTESFYAKSFQAQQESIARASQAEGQITLWNISESNLNQLQKTLEKDIASDANQVRSAKRGLLALANTIPNTTSSECCQRILELQAGLKNSLTARDLELLYAKGDLNAYRQSNSALTEDMIHTLYDGTAQWLLSATQQQQRRRALQLIKKIRQSDHTDEKRGLVQKLYQELSAERAYSAHQHPKVLVFEHRRNLRVRASQIENIEKMTGKNDEINELAMGSGKSDVLAPLVGAEKADGDNLVLCIIPEELIDNDAPRAQGYAYDFYGQKVVRANWKNTTKQGLQTLYSSLMDIRSARGFVAATARDLHDFYLEEQALQRQHFQCSGSSSRERLELFKTIRTLLKTKGHVIIDEVDAQLRCSFEVLKALDKPRTVELAYQNITTTLYNILTTHSRITSKIHFTSWSKARGPDALPYFKERDKDFLIAELSEELLNSDTLAACGVRFEQADQALILAFLRAPEGTLAELPSGLDDKTKNVLAFAKKQLHLILPDSLGKLYRDKQGYGLAPAKKGTAPSILPVPWTDANTPNVHSQFATYDEQMAYVFQTYHKVGVPFALLKDILRKYKAEAHLELESAPVLRELETTEAHRKYMNLLGPELFAWYPKLDAIAQQDIEKIAETISQDPLKLNRFIADYILPAIVTYPAHMSSNGHTIAGMFAHVYGISGTIAKDKNTFHRRFTTETDPSIIGRTIVYLAKGPAPIALPSADTQEEHLKNILKSSGNPPPRAIIDAGALFKDIPPRRLARILLDFGSKQTPPMTAVVYYEGNKRLILKAGSAKPDFYSPSADENPKNRITFYDQKHCTGTDITQDPTARALMTVNKKTDLQQLAQAAWRMRGLASGQTVTMVYPEELAMIMRGLQPSIKTLTPELLISYAKHVEVNKQLDDNRKALFQQIQVEFIQTCQQIVDAFGLSEDPDSLAAMRELNEMMITKIEDAPYDQYGRSEELVDSRIVLHKHLEQFSSRLKEWHDKYSKEFEKASLKEIPGHMEQFKKEMTALIERSTNPETAIIVPKLSLKVSGREGTAIEVQQERAQEQQKDHLVQMELTSIIDRQEKDLSLPYFHWEKISGALQDEGYFAPLSCLEMPKPNDKESSKDYTARLDVYRKALLTQSATPPLSQPGISEHRDNPIASLATSLALTGKFADSDRALAEDMADLFHPDVLVSLNAACSSTASHPFYGAQKLLEWTLIIQDKEHPKQTRLLLLSRKEAEDFQKMLQTDRNEKGQKTGPYKIALFSPRLQGLQFGDGIYEEGSEKLDRGSLFSKPDASALTDFEQQVVQAKFAMGETRYSSKEQAYLLAWLGKMKNPLQAEGLFKSGFLSGSFQKYEKSPLEKVFLSLRQKSSPGALLTTTALTSSTSTGSKTSVPETFVPIVQQTIVSPLPTPTPPLLPPQPPTQPQPIRLSAEELEKEKRTIIESMLAEWVAPLLRRNWMRRFLGEQNYRFVGEVARSPNFTEVLDKLAEA